MEIVYIGTDFDVLTLHGADGTVFSASAKPVCVLHYKPQKKYFKALASDITVDTSANTCDVKWNKSITANMLPGTYSLDIYDKDENIMLYHEDDYAKAIVVSNSPGQNSGTEDESSES